MNNNPLKINLLLIDLDGTARDSVSGQVCPTYPKDQVLRPQFAAKCESLRSNGWVIAAVTNQGGCEAINPETDKPYKTHRQAVAECKYFLELAPWCDRVYMCPNGKNSSRDEVYRVGRSSWLWPRYWVAHEHNEDHPYFQVMGKYRKPEGGMLELAIRDQGQREYSDAFELGINPKDMFEIQINTLMVGDMDSDRQAAEKIEIDYVDQADFCGGMRVVETA